MSKQHRALPYKHLQVQILHPDFEPSKEAQQILSEYQMGQNPLKGYHIKERENKKESERDYDTSGDNRKLRAS